MSLFAYAVRRTIGAVIIFLLVVPLTMFAVASIGPFGFMTGPAGPVRVDEARGNFADAWAAFPVQAIAFFGLVVVAAVACRLVLRRHR